MAQSFGRSSHGGDQDTKWVNREEFSLMASFEREDLGEMRVHM